MQIHPSYLKTPHQTSSPLIIPHMHFTILSFFVKFFHTTRLNNKFVAYLPIYTYKKAKAKSHGKLINNINYRILTIL